MSNYTRSVAIRSEMMKDDSAQALQVKEQVRKGMINATTLMEKLEKLRKAGKDRNPEKATSPASRRAAKTPATDVTPRDKWTEVDPIGAESGFLSTPGLRRHVSTDVLRKLGGRLGLPTKPDHPSGGGHSHSPVRDGAHPSGGVGRRTRSPRRAIGSPRHDAGAEESGGGGGPTLSWRPWSSSSNSSNRHGGQRGTSVPSSPTNRLRSAAVVPWGQGPGAAPAGGVRSSPLSSTPVWGSGIEERGGRPPILVPDGQRAGEQHGQQGAGPTVPLTASEIDNLSSVSNTSTVLTDLSLRLEKIEDMLSRLLETQKNKGPFSENGEIGGLRRASRLSQTSQSSQDSGANNNGNEASRALVRDSLGERSTDQNNHLSVMALHDTAEQLREARGQLQRLEAAGGAARSTSFQTAMDGGHQPAQMSANTAGANQLGPLGSLPPSSLLDTEVTDGRSGAATAQPTDGGEGASEGERKDQGNVGDQEFEGARGGTKTEEEKNCKQERGSGVGGKENPSAGGVNTDRLSTISESPVL